MKRKISLINSCNRIVCVFVALGLTACNLLDRDLATPSPPPEQPYFLPSIAAPAAGTPFPTRPTYNPGEPVDYSAQSGDTLPALAARFNTTVEEILAANAGIPRDSTTMPPELPMKLPIYFRTLWGSPFKILPDSAFVNGPALVGFNTSAFVAAHPGWLKEYRDYPPALGASRARAQLTGAEIVDYVATNYSLSPRLLLAILEYQGGALSLPQPPVKRHLLGFRRLYYESPYLQLVIAANILNNGYYGWRAGHRLEFELPDSSLVRPDPWQNSASVALQYYFAQVYDGDAYAAAIGPAGLYQIYLNLFGDPWAAAAAVIPGSLHQPALSLPFPEGQVWTYTGGPHTGFGSGEPFAAVDFAPPADRSGCFIPEEKHFATAMADGLIVRSGVEGVALDLDKDGDERTGWVIVYLHLAARARATIGTVLRKGDAIGYPSCEGGHATGTHVHISRKYNGEWILADGPLALDMDGWQAHNGEQAYWGTLTRNGLTITACECSDKFSEIMAALPK